MIKKKLNIKKVITYIILPIFIIVFLIFGIYFYMLSPMSNKEKEVIITVKSGETYTSLANDLSDMGLIHSSLFFKLYIKLSKINYLEAGSYKLNENMNVIEIVKILSEGKSFNPDAINITIPEGKHIVEIASIISNITNIDKDVYLNTWNSTTFIDNAIEKYWFITDDIKNNDIRYALEGYLFPSTYELLNKDVSAEYIAYKMLDQMKIILDKYKDKIEESKYSVHELLTLASIVEYEAILDEDRPIIAGIFYNRLDINMKLQSCATVGYAIGEWKITYTTKDLQTVSPYNTYYYSGIPIGPGDSPSEKSIEAVLYPTASNYYYFMADVCSSNPKTYFEKTFKEHEADAEKYLTCF